MGANAQTSVPTFTAGQVLTAAQVNQINTGVPVASGTATRDALFGGSGEKTLAEGQLCYVEGVGLQSYGTAWVTWGTGPQQFAIFNETQTSGTNGGTFTSGSYIKRTLNTTVVNNISGCSIASSVITLPAGTYHLRAECPAHYVNSHKAKLRNTTDSTDTQIGQNGYSGQTTGSGVFTRALVEAYFTITASKNFEIQHRCQTTRNDDGYGGNNGYGDSEIYTTVTIIKVA